MANRIQLRRDTTANWNNIDPVLADGEPGYDIVTNELRIGNGSNVWSELSANTISGGGGTGNTLVNGNYTVGLGANGNLTFPTGNFAIKPSDDTLGGSSVITSANNLVTLSTGVNGGTSSLWVEDYANIGTSNIAAVFANPVPGSKIVRIAVGQNGGAGPKLWDFGTDGNLTLPAGGEIHSATGTGNVVIETNDGNNTRSWTFTGNGVIQNPVLTIATLPSASPAGQRAFVSDGADTAVTWSVAVSATGSNTYPVWSDGIVWRYG